MIFALTDHWIRHWYVIIPLLLVMGVLYWKTTVWLERSNDKARAERDAKNRSEHPEWYCPTCGKRK